MLCKDYETVRNEIKDGDIILYRGNSFLAKSIQYFDKAFYNHIGVAKWINGRLFTIDMWNYGIEFIPLSRRIRGYEYFCVLRPKTKSGDEIENALEDMIQLVDSYTKYDYFLLPRVAIYKATGINLFCLGESKRFICSELVQYYTNKLGLDFYKNIDLITPMEFIRKIDNNYMKLLFDNR